MRISRIRKFAGAAGLVCLATLWGLHEASAQIVTTVAGGFVGDGRLSTQATLQAPQAVALDSHHNGYITDVYTHRIRKVAKNGTITTYAGTGIAGYNGDGIPASSAMINLPTGITLDPAGNIVFADTGNSRVRKMDSTGNISTIAGNGMFGNTGDGGPATQASLKRPWGVIYDSAGDLYISDTADAVVRKVDPSGTITRFAGIGKPEFSGDLGPATQAALNQPTGLALDTAGDLDIADQGNHRVRQVNPAGTINTIAGNGKPGFSGDGGPATDAAINNPAGLAYQGGVLYIGGNAGKDRVRAVSSDRIISTFAGSMSGYDGDHHAPLATQFSNPQGVLPLSASTVLFTDRATGRVRELVGGLVRTVAGGYIGDGRAATSAALVLPYNISFDTAGNLYIADPGGNRIRKVDTAGRITTVAGNSVSGYTGDNGPATSAELNFPFGIVVDSLGNIFIADNYDRAIRKVDAAGIITTLTANSKFSDLHALAVDSSGNLFAVDAASCVVWEITPAITVSVVAGMQSSCGFNGDGVQATTAQLDNPGGIALDTLGNLYIADSSNHRVRMVDTSGIISTIAGDGTCGFTGDHGPANQAEVCSPASVAVSGDVLYIADEDNRRIRKVAGGTITTYAGSGAAGYNGDNLPALSTNMDDPVGVAVDPKGTVYEVDYFQGLVRSVH